MEKKAQRKFLTILRLFKDIVLIANELETLGRRMAARQLATFTNDPQETLDRLIVDMW